MIRGTIQKFAKLGQMGRRPGSRDLLLNFGTPSISKEWLKIQTSNLMCRLATRGTIQKCAKLGQMGRRPGSFDLLLNLGTPSISKERLKMQTSNLLRGLMTRRHIQKFAKLFIYLFKKQHKAEGH